MRALSELFDLSGRVAVVAAGSRGLGLEMAEGLGGRVQAMIDVTLAADASNDITGQVIVVDGGRSIS